jgi:solute carrier family 25, member 39/40
MFSNAFQILSEFRCSPSCTRAILGSDPVCPPDCFQYKGTLDVFLKVVRQVMQCTFFLVDMEVTGNVMINELTILINWLFQEGFGRLWRGTNAGMALAVPTVSSCLVDSVMLLVIC